MYSWDGCGCSNGILVLAGALLPIYRLCYPDRPRSTAEKLPADFLFVDVITAPSRSCGGTVTRYMYSMECLVQFTAGTPVMLSIDEEGLHIRTHITIPRFREAVRRLILWVRQVYRKFVYTFLPFGPAFILVCNHTAPDCQMRQGVKKRQRILRAGFCCSCCSVSSSIAV
jgi:hypothetical protein